MYAVVIPAVLLSVFLFPTMTEATCDAAAITTCSADFDQGLNGTNVSNDTICTALGTLKTCMTNACSGTLDAATTAMFDSMAANVGVDCPDTSENGASVVGLTSALALVSLTVSLLLLLLPPFTG
ncbi:uncharacterized protein LOC143291455 [Babylonia areolata]|uniref:uncharacterized protein LOC143291455 n=1 Tax=Babylonia areolata TaxID=304850 RepID=UPI003FD52DEF